MHRGMFKNYTRFSQKNEMVQVGYLFDINQYLNKSIPFKSHFINIILCNVSFQY